MLGRRALSAVELRCKLIQRGYDDDEASEACARMRDYGYIDDALLARQIGESAARQGRGMRYVAQILARRGLPHPDDAGETKHPPDTDHRAIDSAARRVVQRFGASLQACASPRAMDSASRLRALRFLQRRGFSLSECEAALQQAHTQVHA